MSGAKLKFLLRRIGLTNVQFGEMSGKCESTIRRWKDQREVPLIYEAILENFIGKKRFDTLEDEWKQLQIEKEKRRQEEIARRLQKS